MNPSLLQTQIEELREVTHRLLHLGEDLGFVYADDFSALNREVHAKLLTLYNKKGKTVMQEAELCLALLMGFSACMYANPSDEKKKQEVLNRSERVLDKLPDSLLKCQLLTFCYGEVYEKELADAACRIINTWNKSELTRLQQDTIDMLQIIKSTVRIGVNMHECM